MTLKKTQANLDLKQNDQSFRLGERSFSLVETVVAVSLIALLMVEVSGVHGNAINFADYARKSLQATYLSKRLLSQVEYHASRRTPLKDLAINDKDHVFEDAPDFSYNLTIEPLPNALDLMFKLMSGGMVGGEDGEGGDEGKEGIGAMLEQLKSSVQTAVGEDPIWVAKVSVSWAEGARRSSVDTALIITDIKKLEGTLTPLIAKVPQSQTSTPPPGGLPKQGTLPGQPNGNGGIPPNGGGNPVTDPNMNPQ